MKTKLLFTAFFLTSTGIATADEIRYATWAQPGEAPYAGAEKFKEIVEANSDHTVTIFASEQLGKPKEVFSQMALGSTQIQASGDPGINEIEYLSLPYLLDSTDDYAAVLETDFGQEWNQKLVDDYRVRMLGFMPRSPRQISANRVINSLDDLRGLKIRAPERDYYVQSISALGASPTPMAFAEVYTALQTGIVDGQENPLETIYAQKFFEVQDGIAMVDYIVKPAFVTIAESFWQGLSEDDQALIVRATKESSQLVADMLPAEQDGMIAEMEASGVTVTHPDKAPFIEATQSVRDTLGAQVWGEDVYQQIVEIGRK